MALEKAQKSDEMLAAMLSALGIAAAKQRKYLDVELKREKGVISVPPNMDLSEAIEWLQIKQKAEEQTVALTETIVGFPLDACHALMLAVDQMFGFKEPKAGWTPPPFLSIPVDHKGNTVDIFVGKFRLPGIEGDFITQPHDSSSLMLTGNVKQKHLRQVKELATLARQILATNSLYRGKAFKLDMTVTNEYDMVTPEFINTSAGREDLLLNLDVIAQIEATIWNPIRYMQKCMRLGIPVKRGILLDGNYGTGKSLCANHTARIAAENGWTFGYFKRVEDLAQGYDILRQLQPAVCFCEDIDRIVDDEAQVNTLSNVLDGVDTKDNQILLVLTTNHSDRIAEKAPLLVRAGRIDQSIYFTEPDAATRRKIVEFYATDASTGLTVLSEHLDWPAITHALDGLTPATIREVVEASKLYGIKREPLEVTTNDLVFTAAQTRRHAQLSVLRKHEPTTAEKLYEALQQTVSGVDADTMDRMAATLDTVNGRTRILTRKADGMETAQSAAYEKLEAVEETVDDVQGTVKTILRNQ
jgi:hypothetical protein